jgi:uncharacterized protein (DUF58 family)
MSDVPATFDPAVLARCRLPIRTAAQRSRPGLSTSKHPGTGWEMHAVRPYEFGDDPRRVDWNASARTGALQVRTGLADVAVRMHLLPLIDGSMRFGSTRTKHATAVEALAFLTALAARRGDRTLLQPARRERLLLPARRPETLLTSLLHETPSWEAVTDLPATLEALGAASSPTLLVVVVDLLSLPMVEAHLDPAGRDVLLLLVVDPLEVEPPIGPSTLTDHRGVVFHHRGVTRAVRDRYRHEISRRITAAHSHAAFFGGRAIVLRTDESVPFRMLQELGARR